MSPSPLSLLVGRTVEVFYHGQRSARVLRVAPRSGRLTVRFLFLPQTRATRIDLSALVGVHWRGRRRPLEEYLALRERSGRSS